MFHFEIYKITIKFTGGKLDWLTRTWAKLCRFSSWYKLLNKDGKGDKERGEIDVSLQFYSKNNTTGSVLDLATKKKHLSLKDIKHSLGKNQRTSCWSDRNTSHPDTSSWALNARRWRRNCISMSGEKHRSPRGGVRRCFLQPWSESHWIWIRNKAKSLPIEAMTLLIVSVLCIVENKLAPR